MIRTLGKIVGGMQKQAQAVAHPRPSRLRVMAWLGAGVVGGVALGFLLAPKAGAHLRQDLARWMSGKAEDGVERQMEAMENEGGPARPAPDGQDHRPASQRA